MTIEVQQRIDAPRERVWDIIADIEHADDHLSGIVAVEMLAKPPEGLVGVKWRETRVMFGKEAHETMWVTDADPGYWYEVKAENHGMIYTTRMSVQDDGAGSVLSMSFAAKPVSFGARLMSLLSFLFNGAVRKAFQQDLEDIRALAEAG